MAKRDQNKGKPQSGSTPPPPPETGEQETPAGELPVVVTEATPEVETPSEAKHARLSAKALFAEYEARNADLVAARTAFDVANHNRSRAVKAILDETGSKGPFRHKGQLVTIVSRTAKGKEPGDENTTYFFKGSTSDVIDVD